MDKLGIFKETLDKVNEATSKVVQKAKEVDINDLKKTVVDTTNKTISAAKETGEKLVDSAKEIDVEEVKNSMSEMASKSAAAVMRLFKNEKESGKKAKEILSKKQESNLISQQDSLKIIYLTMMVDGIVKQDEEEKFDEILNDAGALLEKEQIISDCKKAVEKADAEDLYDYVRTKIANLLEDNDKKDKTIKPIHLLWDLMVVAHSDEEYSDTEAKLVRFVIKQLAVEDSLALELEHTYHALLAINKEEEYLKQSNRQYKLIEEKLNELSNRKAVLMQSVYDLIREN